MHRVKISTHRYIIQDLFRRPKYPWKRFSLGANGVCIAGWKQRQKKKQQEEKTLHGPSAAPQPYTTLILADMSSVYGISRLQLHFTTRSKILRACC